MIIRSELYLIQFLKTTIIKNIILFFLITVGITSAYAECAMSGMSFFPKTKAISLNSMFIIQAYAFSQETIGTFKNRMVYLESENGEIVELKIQEILKGRFQLTQAIFCPISELKPNTTYFLKYTDQTEMESYEMKQWNADKKEQEKVYWKTTNKKSLPPLNSNLSLAFDKTEVVQYGCGASANAIFRIHNKSEFEVWYKTELVAVKTKEKTIYYIKEWNGKLHVGHGMCAGAFTFHKKGKHKERFTPINTEGTPNKTTEWHTFDSPFLKV